MSISLLKIVKLKRGMEKSETKLVLTPSGRFIQDDYQVHTIVRHLFIYCNGHFFGRIFFFSNKCKLKEK